MKNPAATDGTRHRPSDDETIEAIAAAWLAQRDDVMTPDNEREFAGWRAADARHEAAVARLERTWAMLQPLRDFRPEAARHPDRNLLARPARGRVRPFPIRLLAVAAAAAFVLATSWWALRSFGDHAAASTYATTVGGYERVMLADGSVLELNGGSSAQVRFTATERRVQLVRGEAHFTVAKNAARPFWVEAGGVAVRAVGTAFNVRLGIRDVEVLVTEGKVALNQFADPAVGGRSPAVLSVGGATLLSANERTRIAMLHRGAAANTERAPVVERVAPEVIRDALAWQGSSLSFVDTPLSQVAAQFNRHNVVQLVIADPELESLPVAGRFRAENIEAFVRLLESGGDVTVDRNDPTRLVLHGSK